MTAQNPKIRPRERDTIIQALAAGVVPRVGLSHIQVGRAAEVSALIQDIERIAHGGSSIRFIIGEYGSGKTFFAQLVRLIALEKKCVTVHADLSPDRRIHASGGQARALYSEAISNLSTRTKPDGNALSGIVERFISDAVKEAEEVRGPVDQIIDRKLVPIRDFVGGYDFAVVLKAYCQASEEGNEALKDSAIRWLRGEYSTKTQAKQELGVRTIVDDDNIYDAFKILSSFVRIAGYAGLLVMLDEMVNIYKLQNAQARKQNYEQILHIVNDALQGNTSGIGFVMCGTRDFLTDTRRGLYSYEALQSRLSENTFAKGSLVDLSGPIVRLQNLTPEDLLVLLSNIRSVFASGDRKKFLVPDEALTAFMDHCHKRIGEAYFRTPRTTIRAFVQLLSVLQQNPRSRWEDLLGTVAIAPDLGGAEDNILEPMMNGSDDELTTLRIGT